MPRWCWLTVTAWHRIRSPTTASVRSSICHRCRCRSSSASKCSKTAPLPSTARTPSQVSSTSSSSPSSKGCSWTRTSADPTARMVSRSASRRCTVSGISRRTATTSTSTSNTATRRPSARRTAALISETSTLRPQAFPNNGTFTVPGMVAPQNAVQAGDPNAGYFLLPGCAAQNLDPSGGCIWDINKYNKIQPRTAGLNLSGRWTQNLAADGWRNALTMSWFNSQAEQYRQSESYSTGPVTIPYTWGGSGGILVDQTDPNATTMVLPASHPDNPFNPASPYFGAAQAFYGANFASYIGQPALLYAVLTDFRDQQIRFNTDVLRIVSDVTGRAGGWDLNFSARYVRAATRATR